MATLQLTLAVDVPAYATLNIGLSESQIIAITDWPAFVREQALAYREDCFFDPEWDSSDGYRVVDASLFGFDSRRLGEPKAEDVPVDTTPLHDVGLLARTYLGRYWMELASANAAGSLSDAGFAALGEIRKA